MSVAILKKSIVTCLLNGKSVCGCVIMDHSDGTFTISVQHGEFAGMVLRLPKTFVASVFG